jgi:hypothetical protein
LKEVPNESMLAEMKWTIELFCEKMEQFIMSIKNWQVEIDFDSIQSQKIARAYYLNNYLNNGTTNFDNKDI